VNGEPEAIASVIRWVAAPGGAGGCLLSAFRTYFRVRCCSTTQAIRPQDPATPRLTTQRPTPSVCLPGPTRWHFCFRSRLFGFLVDPGGPAVDPQRRQAAASRRAPTLDTSPWRPASAALARERCAAARTGPRGPTGPSAGRRIPPPAPRMIWLRLRLSSTRSRDRWR